MKELPETYLSSDKIPQGSRHESDDGSSSAGGDSDSHNTSETPGSTNNAQSAAKKELQNEFMGHDETRYANRIKILLGVIFLLTMVGVVTAVYVAMSKGETNNFENDFSKKETYFLERFEKASTMAVNQTRALCTTFTSYSTYQIDGNSFPNVTVPDIAQRANATMMLSGAQVIGFFPMVPTPELDEWQAYAVKYQDWLSTDLKYTHPGVTPRNLTVEMFPFHADNAGPYPFVAPLWQLAPTPLDWSFVTKDFSSKAEVRAMMASVIRRRHARISDDITDVDLNALYAMGASEAEMSQPKSYVIQSVFEDITDDAPTVGILISMFSWSNLLKNLMAKATMPMLAVIRGTKACSVEFTYRIEGPKATFLDYGNLGDQRYVKLGLVNDIPFFNRTWIVPDESMCRYHISMYPTAEFESHYHTSQPIIYTCIILACFICVLIMFVIYDVMISRRHNFLYGATMRTNEFVTSLFPETVHKQMLQDAYAETKNAGGGAASGNAKSMLKDFTAKDGVAVTQDMFKSKPLADLFPNCTIMFADLQGFTAWSSMREPTQVFMLLETIYHAFDQIANRRRVFKVETVGDCYVAVSGLPEPRKDHAVTMARFASDCVNAMPALLAKLSTELGPDTSELQVRVGLNSGPVTAGVLRGEKARFQLFGDTVNTTARIETTGAGSRIHVSLDTADIITSAGKGHWLEERKDVVHAKGKGALKTFWLKINKASNYATSNTDSGTSSGGSVGAADTEQEDTSVNEVSVKEVFIAPQPVSEKYARLIDWNTEILFRILKQVVARRDASKQMPTSEAQLRQLEMDTLRSTRIVLDEQVDVIMLPKYDSEVAARQVNPDDIVISEDIHDLLREYMQDVATSYRDNPFHNFEHVSHVTMSVVKLLSRIVAPDLSTSADKAGDDHKMLHDHTYGITSDPLTQFACVFSALIHDVDHCGVPNAQLIKEDSPLATVYKQKSIAEQNSVDLAWASLMEDRFAPLRRIIYSTKDEFQRFRQLVVNAVMATDIMDRQASLNRKSRWIMAFDGQSSSGLSSDEAVNRKATIVIEHIIQASDVAHTMQHWHIYRKWNARLFEEMWLAHRAGRADACPSINWYKGEIGFFDFYIIPLAKKLKDCGVFGVSSDEYLTYAQQNRKEFENKGAEIVASMVKDLEEKHSTLLYL
ncbi:hypothetical protein MPSEU_000974900 [Mayamaea pseudoterrestris]|nr:hypothetical protein MPSEU_000974900 [Mayamaea pseudoterrestris]